MKRRIVRIAAVLSFFTALCGIGFFIYYVYYEMNSLNVDFIDTDGFLGLLLLIGSLSVLTLTTNSLKLLNPSKESLLQEKIKILELEKKIKELEEDG